MQFPTLAQLSKAVHNGWFNEAAKDIRTYGTIVSRNDWDEETGYYKGCNSWIECHYFGHRWVLGMLNGECVSIERSLSDGY